MFQDYINYKFKWACVDLIALSVLAFWQPNLCCSELNLENLIEGKHYKSLPVKKLNTKEIMNYNHQHPYDVHVIEFFGYACHFCNVLHPYLQEWSLKKPSDVDYDRVPVVFNRPWEVLAKAYYTAESLNCMDQVDVHLFDAIHKNRMNLANEKELERFFVAHGIEADKFQATYASFEVSRKLKMGIDVMKNFGIIATPAVIVYGEKSSYITDLDMVGDEKSLIEVINLLIDKVKRN